MRETMGRYIAELDAEGRDRLIAAPEFSDGEWWSNGCGCLVGTAERWDEADDKAAYAIQRQHHMPMRRTAPQSWRVLSHKDKDWSRTTAAYRYPLAVDRFGKARVVRAVKQRASRLNDASPAHIAALTAPHEQPQSVP